MDNITYQIKRATIKSGDLLIWSSSDSEFFLSYRNIIRFFTRSEYAHVAIAWVIANRVMMLDVAAPRIKIRPLSEMSNCYHVPMQLNWNDKLEQKLLSYVGKPYSYLQALMSYFTKPLKDNKWHCVEVVKDFYSFSGIEIDSDYTPSGLVTAILNLPERCLSSLKISSYGKEIN
jgi:hypothetical protein